MNGNENELMRELFESPAEERTQTAEPAADAGGGDEQHREGAQDLERELLAGGMRRDAAALFARLMSGERLTAGEVIAAADFARCPDTGLPIVSGRDSRLRAAFGLE